MKKILTAMGLEDLHKDDMIGAAICGIYSVMVYAILWLVY